MAQRIGFSRRFFASSIDTIFLTVIILFVLVVGFVLFVKIGWIDTQMLNSLKHRLQSRSNSSSEPFTIPMPISMLWLVVVVITILYKSMEVFYATSPGKMILGICIAGADGQPATLRQLLIRFFIKYGGSFFQIGATITGLFAVERLGGLFEMIIGFGCLLALGSRAQALHDRIADTAVFRSSQVGDIETEEAHLFEGKIADEMQRRAEKRASAPDPQDLFKPRW